MGASSTTASSLFDSRSIVVSLVFKLDCLITMNRYLLNFSYNGTRFRGVQKIIIKENPILDTKTVQGSLELALQVLRPVNRIQTFLSSRTDAGVHALHSTIHVDLERPNGEPYDTHVITGVLNRTLGKHELPIRVIETIRVPESFHCRYNAKGRTYLYRFAVAKHGPPGDLTRNQSYQSFIPIDELKQCYFLQDHRFDINAFREAANLFKGRHDFRTFMSTSRHSKLKNPMFTIRSISDIKVYPGKSLAIHFDAEKADALYNYWNLEISGRSFLYKQVRRIFGSLLAVAYNRITLKDIYEMLTIPSAETWISQVVVVPPHGLYLCKIHYDEKDLQFPEQDTITPSVSHESPPAIADEEKQAQAN